MRTVIFRKQFFDTLFKKFDETRIRRYTSPETGEVVVHYSDKVKIKDLRNCLYGAGLSVKKLFGSSKAFAIFLRKGLKMNVTKQEGRNAVSMSWDTHFLKKQIDLSSDDILILYRTGNEIELVQDKETLDRYYFLLEKKKNEKKEVAPPHDLDKIKDVEMTPDLKENQKEI